MHLLLQSADFSPLGRFDPATLTEQEVMEIMFAPDNFDQARVQLGGGGEDRCSWLGVECNKAKNVTSIIWHGTVIALKGNFNFEMLPTHLTRLILYMQEMSGEIQTSRLPEGLDMLIVQACHFTGTVDMQSLPPKLRKLIITGNEITHISDIRGLPKRMEICKVNEMNVREAKIFVGKLPSSALEIDLRDCRIEKLIFEYERDRERVLV